MIEVTQLNDRTIMVNAELIETLEAAPHTILTLTTNRKLMLKDSVADVVAKAIAYRRTAYFVDPASLAAGRSPDGESGEI